MNKIQYYTVLILALFSGLLLGIFINNAIGNDVKEENIILEDLMKKYDQTNVSLSFSQVNYTEYCSSKCVVRYELYLDQFNEPEINESDFMDDSFVKATGLNKSNCEKCKNEQG